MPTNLPTEYFEVEKEYKAAETPSERIRLLEELISTVPKHKGTDKLRADLRRRLSKLKSASKKSKSKGRHDSAWRFDREGARQVVIIGPANVGKSALVTALTNATPEVADYPFTTRMPTPGMMIQGDVQIQLIDTPALDQEYIDPEFFDLVRRADVIVIVLDLQTYPDTQLKQTLQVLKQHRIVPISHQHHCDESSRMVVKPIVVVANKSDDDASEELFFIFCELLEEDWACIPISATTGRNLDRLKKAIFRELAIIRVYSKPPGQEPDFSTPFVLEYGSTIEQFAEKVHKDFVNNLKAARVWGSAIHDGQLVGRDYILEDGDVVELRI